MFFLHGGVNVKRNTHYALPFPLISIITFLLDVRSLEYVLHSSSHPTKHQTYKFDTKFLLPLLAIIAKWVCMGCEYESFNGL